MKSLLPEGEITDVSQLPTSIPAYLVKVVPELRVEGEVVLTGTTAMALGTDFDFRYSTDVVSHGRQEYTSVIPAGSYYAVMVAGGSVSAGRVAAAKGKVEATKGTLAGQDAALIGGLTRDDVWGEMFYSGALGYSVEYSAMSETTALRQNALSSIAPSLGVYGYKPRVAFSFGYPRATSVGGIEMDAPGLKGYNATLNGDRGQLISVRFQVGMLSSALEHVIPEQMFAAQDSRVEGVSAVKALAKAAQEGQKIFLVTRENVATAMSQIRVGATAKDEIEAAVAVGKEVVAHSDPVSVPGWSGAGYVIFDPASGDGAYKISGGQNGSFWFGYFIGQVLLMTAVLLLASCVTPFAATALAVFAGLAVWVAAVYAVAFATFMQWEPECFRTGFGAGIAVTTTFTGAGGVIRGVVNDITGVLAYVVAGLNLGGLYESWRVAPSNAECSGLVAP